MSTYTYTPSNTSYYPLPNSTEFSTFYGHNGTLPEEVEVAGIIGLVLYTAVLAVTVVFAALHIRANSEGKEFIKSGRIQFSLFSFSILFLIARLAWLIQNLFFADALRTSGSYILNRVAYAFLYTCYTLIVSWWTRTFEEEFLSSRGSLQWFRRLLIASVLFIWALQILDSIVFAVRTIKEPNRVPLALAVVNLIVVAGISGLIVLLFLVNARALYMSKRVSVHSGGLHSHGARYLAMTMIFGLLFVACFVLRGVVFTLDEIDRRRDNSLPPSMYLTFGYIIPEILPTSVQLYLIRRKIHSDEKGEQFIRKLYRDSQDTDGALVVYAKEAGESTSLLGSP